jgi:hypothetical protein
LIKKEVFFLSFIKKRGESGHGMHGKKNLKNLTDEIEVWP